MSNKSSSKKLIFMVIIATILLIGFNLLSDRWNNQIKELPIANNKGVSWLTTIEDTLLAVFQDGQVCVWDWGSLSEPYREFKIPSDRAVFLGDNRLAVINHTGRKILSVVDLSNDQKISDISVGQIEQDIWPRTSPDRKVLMLVRKDLPLIGSEILDVEFLTVDIEQELLGIPYKLMIKDKTESIEDSVVSSRRIAYAVGSQDGKGWILAMDLNTGRKQWDRVYSDTGEFCSLELDRDEKFFYAGNRNGFLYKLDIATGDIAKKIRLLEEGETRSVTNDFSVLNLAFSNNGQFFVATINPKVYILRTNTDQIIHTCSPADRLVSKIAFSPDNRFFATSDIRAGYPVKIWEMPEALK